MNGSFSEVPTEHASSYLKQLCRHWSHKFSVEFDDNSGRIELPNASCILEASPAMLRVQLELKEGADEAHMQRVVEEHLQRFGFRETLVFDWRSAS